jgi:hypothetical protein
MDKTAYERLVKQLYLPSAKKPAILRVPPLQFAMINGTGDPNTSEVFQNAVGALYAVSYGIRMLPKKGIVPPGYFEYKVSALEGLWDMPAGEDYDASKKGSLTWTLMIMQPPFVTSVLFDDILAQQQAKKKLEALNDVRFETLDEGLCCQMMHIGPFDNEPTTFEIMHAYIRENGFTRSMSGHHEIYLSDFRKTAPEKLKTVLRVRIQEP